MESIIYMSSLKDRIIGVYFSVFLGHFFSRAIRQAIGLIPFLVIGWSNLYAAENALDLPFKVLRQAYAERDAIKAASAYSDDARLNFQNESEAEHYIGTSEITASFEELFSRVDSALKLDLNFRISSSEIVGDGIERKGIYRLRFGDRSTSYGRFTVLIAANDTTRFVSDLGQAASIDDFESLAGPLLFDNDLEDLDPLFYGRLAGRFALDSNCSVVVTLSQVRLFARNTCTNQLQGLSRLSGLVWTGGDTVLFRSPTDEYRFLTDASSGAVTAAIEIARDDAIVVAIRDDASNRRSVNFLTADGVSMGGDLYIPVNNPSGLATVFVHGSGPQDRNGYASIIAITAEELAAQGNTVLTFDKRGVGESGGDWSVMGFESLAADAISAMAWLEEYLGGDVAVGLAGSSQAGWVVAKAIELGATPHHVHLLGAAGAALSVEEQNIYNTRVRMTCEGIPADKIELALNQQKAFFEYVKTRSNPDILDALTASLSNDPVIEDWLFPSSAEIDFDGGDWFTTLEISFDPLPIWTSFAGKGVFVFSEYDDSTPTDLAVNKLAAVRSSLKGELTIYQLPATQHLGLEASSLCSAGLDEVSRFSSDFFHSLQGITEDD